MKYFIVGAGIWGSVVAERIANGLGAEVVILDKRDHVGGNSASFRDAATGIECHTYGSHIFHTSLKEVYDYISKFCTLNTYQHKVLTLHDHAVYQMPINLSTINTFYKTCYSPSEARAFLAAEVARDAVAEPKNLEEQAISLIGRPLYEAFIQNYTRKQWGRAPAELPASIIRRLPIRASYDANYFSDPWQGIPLDGYQALFDRLLAHPRITVLLDTDYKSLKTRLPSDAVLIYTGMPDELFDYEYGNLEWRSLRFEFETCPVQDFQGTSVMNYADLDVPWTRIHEFKHYHPERAIPFREEKTVICREYPAEWLPGREAYYPVNDERNTALYARYADKARQAGGLILGGRLGTYRYFDMDKAIADALQCFETQIRPQALNV